MSDDNSGKRFSLVYLTSADGLPDSARARVRVANLIEKCRVPVDELANLVESKLGIRMPTGYSGYQLDRFVEHCSLRDFLDLISLIADMMSGNSTARKRWIELCREIYAEERLRYAINDAGGVRFAADSVFEHGVQTTIAHLGHPALSGAKSAFADCLRSLSSIPPDGKSAVRSIFEAVETAFKTLCPGPPRIGGAEIKAHLEPILKSHFSSDDVANKVALKLARRLVEWVDAAHFYRHGQPGTEPVQPPLTLAVAITSQGMGFLRWLAELHATTT